MALLIRRTEQRLLSLHAEGKLFGTVHTCIGQEFSAVAVGRALRPDDTVFSNHRGHRHFLATGGTVHELIAEMGKSTGVCKGRGGSQHLQKGRYFSNGIPGGIVPVPAGLALAHKLSGSRAIVRSPLAAAKATFALNAAPKYSPLPGHHPAPDRVPPTREAPPYQGARKSESTSGASHSKRDQYGPVIGVNVFENLASCERYFLTGPDAIEWQAAEWGEKTRPCSVE